MKRFYTLLLALAVVSALQAQRIEKQHTFEAALYPASDIELENSRIAGEQNLNMTRGGGEFFCEDKGREIILRGSVEQFMSGEISF